jgi:thioester reductase-like protein
MPRPGYSEVTLLTGFPSFLARRLAAHILEEEPGTLVYAIVRSKFAHEAQTTVDTWPKNMRSRFIMIEGDAAAMDLGLSGVEFRALSGEIDRIHHAAQVTYLGVDPRTAKQLNVDGTGEVIELARASPSLKCLVLHSTAEVAGDRTGVVREDELEAGQRFPTFIAETRARAEKLARHAMTDVPIAVVRPATIVGDSLNGEIDRFDGPYLLILLIVTTPAEIAVPLPGRGDSPLNLVPIDFVVRAARALGRHPRAPGRTFHLVDPNPLTAKRIFDLVARASDRPAPRGFIPTNLTKALLRTPGLERFAKSPRAFVDRLATRVRFDARNADEILTEARIACPPFESYVGHIVDYVRERVREKRERRDFSGMEETDADPIERRIH